MNKEVIKEMSERSLAGTVTFPEVVKALLKAGIESYTVDLVRNSKIFYSVEGETFAGSFDFKGPKPAPEFSAEAVVNAIRASQAGKITYPQFLEQILNAGCSFYTAYLTGRKVVYLGRKGDFHVEHFPK